MPIYEFVCVGCGRRFRRLVGMVATTAAVQCPGCGSVDLKRQISRFARVRTEDDALDAIADDMEASGDPDDPRTMRRFVREMGSAMDEDLGDEFEQMMEEEAGGSSGETDAEDGI